MRSDLEQRAGRSSYVFLMVRRYKRAVARSKRIGAIRPNIGGVNAGPPRRGFKPSERAYFLKAGATRIQSCATRSPAVVGSWRLAAPRSGSLPSSYSSTREPAEPAPVVELEEVRVAPRLGQNSVVDR